MGRLFPTAFVWVRSGFLSGGFEDIRDSFWGVGIVDAI